MSAVPVPVLELDGLGLSFGAIAAVGDVCMSFAAGGRYGLLGANGAGKTTLFNLISGELTPSRGRVLLGGVDVTRLSVHERVRRGMRRTFQSSRLLRDCTVLENLVLAVQGPRGGHLSPRRWTSLLATRREAEALLEVSALGAHAHSAAGLLSHGQQRQLEIAMGLAGDPQVILFDEPAAGLSPHERERLHGVLAGLPAQVCMLLIEHDLDVAMRFASHITVMHQGQVFRQGTPAEIERDAEVQAIYMGRSRHER